MQLDLLTSSPGDTPASHSVSPGSAAARTMTVTSGLKCIGSWLSVGPLGSLERTLLSTSIWGSTRCFLTWKTRVTPAGRLLFRLWPSMPRTAETGSGLWPTTHGFSPDGKSNGPSGNELGRAVNQSLLPTPKASPSGPDFARRDRVGSGGDDLATAVARMWPTPVSDDTGLRKKKYAQGGTPLSMAAGMWPTPDATPRGATPNFTGKRPSGHKESFNLQTAAKMWPTPTAQDASNTGGASQHKRNTLPLNTAVMYPTMDAGAAKGRGQASADQRSRLGGSLNPEWVEWLMGFPAGWTNLTAEELRPALKTASPDLNPSATPLSRQ